MSCKSPSPSFVCNCWAYKCCQSTGYTNSRAWTARVDCTIEHQLLSLQIWAAMAWFVAVQIIFQNCKLDSCHRIKRIFLFSWAHEQVSQGQEHYEINIRRKAHLIVEWGKDWLICCGSESRQTHIIQSYWGTVRLAKSSILTEAKTRVASSLLKCHLEIVSLCSGHKELWIEEDYGHLLGIMTWVSVFLHGFLYAVIMPQCMTDVYNEESSLM